MPDSAVRFARYPSLEGKVVFISGGASGIGATVVSEFVDQGASVATIDLMSGAHLSDRVWFRQCDVRDVAALQRALAEAAADLGPVAVLINNVARDDRFDNEVMTPDEWDEMQAVNLRHVYFASQAVRDGMIALGGGSIINFTSPSVDKKDAHLVGYATAKAGIVGLTRTLAGDLGRHRIRVNAVQPGWVFTERQQRLWVTESTGDAVRTSQALPDLTDEHDVARVVLFLASDDSKAVTATVYKVDAGWT